MQLNLHEFIVNPKVDSGRLPGQSADFEPVGGLSNPDGSLTLRQEFRPVWFSVTQDLTDLTNGPATFGITAAFDLRMNNEPIPNDGGAEYRLLGETDWTTYFPNFTSVRPIRQLAVVGGMARVGFEFRCIFGLHKIEVRLSDAALTLANDTPAPPAQMDTLLYNAIFQELDAASILISSARDKLAILSRGRA